MFYRKWLFLTFLLLISMTHQGFSAIDHSAFFADGEKAFAASNFAAAAENFAAALKYTPQNLRARFRYGQALFSLNRFSESHSQFQAVLQNSPNNIIARVYLAENLVQLKRNEDARTHLEWILKVQPGHARARSLFNSITDSLQPSKAAAVNEKQVEPISEPRVEKMPEQMPVDLKPLPVKELASSKKEKEVKLVPFVAVSGEKQVKRPLPAHKSDNREIAKRVSRLPAAISVEDFSFENFQASVAGSFLFNLEMVKFYLENGDLNAAAVSLDKAILLAGASADSRRFLELQILTGMLHIYRRDFDSFGRHLVKLKPALGDKSYQSFSNIYNEGAALSDPIDQARLAAGIAMGAGHHAVAARLLLEVFVKKPDDLLTAHLLADAQMHSFDYQGAENTLVHIARNHTDNAEAHFNLARFYLTAFYQPQLARRYAAHAASLKPGDARIELITGLIDYAEGNIAEGITRIEKLLPKVNDSGMQQICQQIIEDGKHSDQSGQPLDFAGMLALPGAPHAQPGSFRLPGEDALRQGSFLTAMKYFADAGDYAEIGRAYLGMASSFAVSGEKDTAAVAAGFGLGALASELQQNPANGRASLYSALYHVERNDYTTARQILDYGLAGNNDALTRQRLIALRESIDS